MKTKTSGGFTLLELLITIVLLAMGVVPLIWAMAEGIRADKSIDRRVIALGLAQEKIEAVRNTAFASVAAEARAALDAPFEAYSREVEVSSTDPKQVTVTVDWDFEGETLELVLTTLVANRS